MRGVKQRATVPTTFKIQPNLTPHPDAVRTGQTLTMEGGHVAEVYKRNIKKYRRVPLRDADGNQLYHLNADGTKRAPRWINEEYTVEQTGIYVPMDGGVTQWHQVDLEQARKEAEREAARKEYTPEKLAAMISSLREDLEAERAAREVMGITDEDVAKLRQRNRK